MPGIAKKLRFLIGNQAVHAWAKDHDISGTTVHDWIKFDRRPAGASMKALVAATGKPKEWWYSEEEPLPEAAPPAPADPRPLTESGERVDARVAERRVSPLPASPINATALSFILAGVLSAWGKDADTLALAKQTVKLYAIAMEEGLITAKGVGEGGAKAA